MSKKKDDVIKKFNETRLKDREKNRGYYVATGRFVQSECTTERGNRISAVRVSSLGTIQIKKEDLIIGGVKTQSITLDSDSELNDLIFVLNELKGAIRKDKSNDV